MKKGRHALPSLFVCYSNVGVTSMLPRVAFEYGQTMCALCTAPARDAIIFIDRKTP